MWFKNLLIYKITSPLSIQEHELNQLLEAEKFSPCGKLDPIKIGWSSPISQTDSLYHANNGCWIVCAKKQEKILPSGVIREKLDEKVHDIEQAEDRKIYRKEKDSLKDEIIFDCLPQAFTRSQKIYIAIDTRNGFLYVDSASYTKAEEVLKLLRQTLGSLPLIPLQTQDSPQQVMTSWLKTEEHPGDLQLLEECELKEPGEEGSVIKCRRIDLHSPEVKQHIESGSMVSKLALQWQDNFRCLLHEDLSIKRLKFEDRLIEESNDNSQGDPAAQFDSDFQLMMLSLREFTARIADYFGGYKAEGI